MRSTWMLALVLVLAWGKGAAAVPPLLAATSRRLASLTLARNDIARLREVSASQGLMLESTAERLCARGGPHFGSPDKQPAARLETIRLAGELAVPFTTGILIGIGETREERVESLLALQALSAL